MPLEMPSIDDREVRVLQANLVASLVVGRLELKFVNVDDTNDVHKGMDPSLVLAQMLIFYRRNGAEK